MKKLTSMLLAIAMLLSIVPSTAFAQNDVDTAENTVVEPQYVGNTVNIGSDMYSLQDGDVYISKNYGRDKKLADGKITWLVEDNGFVYWSKVNDNHTTDIIKYNTETEEQTTAAHTFVPVEAFDVSGDDVCYLYNGEISKINIATGDESFVMVDKSIKGFYLDENNCITVIDEPSEEETVDKESEDIDVGLLVYDDSHKTSYKGKTLPLSEYDPSQGAKFFTKNGQKCENFYWSANKKGRYQCHDHNVCVEATHEQCNCVRYWSATAPNYSGTKYNHDVDLGSSQCAGFARWVQWKLFGEIYNPKGGQLGAKNTSGKGSSRFTIEYPEGITASNIKEKFKNVTLGAHIRTKPGHSMVFMESNDTYIWTYEGNADGYCGVRVVKRTWADMAYYLKNGVAFIVIPKADMYHTCQYATIKDSTGKLICGTCKVCKTPFDYKSKIEYKEGGSYTKKKEYLKKKKLPLKYEPYADAKNYTYGYCNELEITGYVVNAYGNKWYVARVSDFNGNIYVYSGDIDGYYDIAVYAKKYESSNYYYDTASTININATQYPIGNILKGKSFGLRGTITSKHNITKIVGEIINASTGKVASSVTVSPGTSKYIIDANAKLNTSLVFGGLQIGTYYLKYTVTDSSGTSPVSWQSGNFNVVTKGTKVCEMPSVNVQNTAQGRKVTVSCGDDNALIHCTVNGAERTGYSSLSFELATAGTYNISAWTTRSKYTQSAVNNKTISIEKVAAPQISDVTYGENNAWITMSGNGDMHYTLNNLNPTNSSSKYNGNIYLTADSTTVKAIGVKYGYQNSDVATKVITLRKPAVPTGLTLYNTKTKIAQNKTATVKWNATQLATSYIASLYYEGEWKGDYVTKGTMASFKLPNVGNYTITVRARNFKGDSDECAAVAVQSMAPVTVTFVDRILREGKVNDSTVSQIQKNIEAKYAKEGKSNPPRVEGNILSVQTIDYDSKPSFPMYKNKQGFENYSFGNLTQDPVGATPITENTTIYAYYTVKSYNVSFWNYYTANSNSNKQIGNTQEVLYTFSATPPSVSPPTGYVLSGWSVDNTVSQCQDYKYVTGDMKLHTAYAWANKSLPAVVSISKVARDEKCTSYKVDLKYTNNNFSDTQARVIVSLYSSDGRMVYTQTKDLDMDKFKIGQSLTDSITLNYSHLIARVKCVLVGVKNGLTGGAVSALASTTSIVFPDTTGYWTAWSTWSTTKPTASSTKQVKSKTQYSFSDKITGSSSSTKKWDGWTYVNTVVRSTSTSGWTTTKPTEFSNDSQTRKITATEYIAPKYKTQYRYGRWTNGSKFHFCPNYAKSLYGGTWTAQYSSWSDSPASPTKTKYYYCSSSSHNHKNPAVDGSTDYWNQYKVNGGTYYWQETQQVQTQAGYYRYKYTDTYYTHNFYKWTDYSAWSDTVYTKSSTREVKTRPVYSYRDYKLNYPGYDPNKDSGLEEKTIKKYTIKGNVSGVSGDFSGKKATVMVYKKSNTDPTQEQLEYVDQITLGSGNSYSFVVNPKEAIDYERTGDFIVTLALEGCERLVNIDVIEAEVPKYSVTFYSDNGEQFGNQHTVSLGDSIDVNAIGIPKKEGKRFVKWDKPVINIDKNTTVNAVWENVKVPVVFIDYENETVNIQEFEYGSTISVPEVTAVEGKEFVGWVVESDPENTESGKEQPIDKVVVTEPTIVSAKWNPIKYTVQFLDFDGKVVHEQDVAYGESATPPAGIEKDGVIYGWDLTTNEWWNVKSDMVVFPYVPLKAELEAPTITASTDIDFGMFSAELETTSENAKIYYTYGEPITEEDAKSFAEELTYTLDSDVEELSLMSEEGAEDVGEGESVETYSVFDSINEYDGSIDLWAGSVIYAFTADDKGNFSPISVFQYDYNSDTNDVGVIPNETIIGEDSAQIRIPTITANPGETVTIPVEIKNNPGLTNLSLLLGFDADSLTLNEVRNGDVFAESELSFDTRDDGSCKFAWETAEVNSKDGTLLNLVFTVSPDASADDLLLDIMIDYTEETTDAEQQIITVSGSIDSGIQGVLGDVNGDEEVDFADAIQILKYDAGLTELEENQIAVGDVNSDGEVDFADAIQILKLDAGLIEEFNRE